MMFESSEATPFAAPLSSNGMYVKSAVLTKPELDESTYALVAQTASLIATVIVLAPSLYVFVRPVPTARAEFIASCAISVTPGVSHAPYASVLQAPVPLPNLNLFVSVSYPISPAARIGFTEVQSAATPLLT